MARLDCRDDSMARNLLVSGPRSPCADRRIECGLKAWHAKGVNSVVIAAAHEAISPVDCEAGTLTFKTSRLKIGSLATSGFLTAYEDLTESCNLLKKSVDF